MRGNGGIRKEANQYISVLFRFADNIYNTGMNNVSPYPQIYDLPLVSHVFILILTVQHRFILCQVSALTSRM
jgi:hypothetical protein